ncbi:glycoside hydrolase family 127 protein [Actinoplanes oblitus]|uniref:Glycoside hydrolase family 127 protein n=1 Tax=Actinoplanes oblitus TaxID=3040509 RepID=A0ABY8WBC4_9ACTN|nr:beta-L-arabinofuranosidase domain-containing protein [Actinoplanes oblitus]WIM95164.1 glycoside hydrolase family 127 protein [Actinoplanes oblitus]
MPTSRAVSALRPLPREAVTLRPESLFGGWQARNAAVTLPHCVAQLDAYGNLANLRRVTGDAAGEFRGFWFADSDVYKTLEAAFWGGDESGFVADAASLLEKAQDADGYLDSYYQVDHRDKQWSELHFSHEMYCAGHLFQAAVAAARSGAAAAPQVVSIARRFADLLVRRYAGSPEVDGHPEVETALVELYRVTGHRPYLDLAARFVANRGHGVLGEGRFGPRYFQDHQPVTEADEVTGHVVRQVYLLAGAVDVAVETGDAELLAAAERLWDSALESRTYLTGGQGSRHRDEAYGDPYELPPDRAYAESCAAIGSFQWAWRLLLATGKPKYADEMERLIYNGIAGSTGLDGATFFYSNPLQLRTGHDGSHEDAPSQRLPWYSCACCPPNLARLMASLDNYAATGDAAGLQLHLYTAGTFRAGGHAVDVRTDYPWDETITVTVTEVGPGPWALSLRIPAWCTRARLTVNGEPVDAGESGWVVLERTWLVGDRVELTLAMPPLLITAHPRVDAVRGAAAVVRGPMVYCLEHADAPAGVPFEDLELDASAPPRVLRDPDGLAPVLLRISLRARPSDTPHLYRPLPAPARATPPVAVTAIPYHLWANREPGPMRVFIPLSER